jgi:hypothetical protein
MLAPLEKLAVDAELGGERVDQRRQKRDVVGRGGGAGRPAVVPARVPEGLGIDDDEAIAVRQLVERAARAALEPRGAAAPAVQREHQRPAGLGLAPRV